LSHKDFPVVYAAERSRLRSTQRQGETHEHCQVSVKRGARDHTSGDPVTNFKRTTRLYRLAMSHNKGLDATSSPS
jgi:hypothetical protein